MGFKITDTTQPSHSSQESGAWADLAADVYSPQSKQNRCNSHHKSESANSTKSAEKYLPTISLCHPENKKPLAHRVEDQKHEAHGTKEHPVTENCQTTAVKNAFHYFDKDDDAKNVRPEMERMLDAISKNHGKGMDVNAVGKAIDHNQLDHFTSDQVKRSIKSGDLSPFVGSPPGEKDKAYVNPEAMHVYLAEKGCHPEGVKLGTDAAADKVKQALDANKPVIFEDKPGTHTLVQEQANKEGTPYEKTGGETKGHTYMAYKDKNDGKYYVVDNQGKPVPVDPEVLQKKLHDQKSGAIIVHNKPDENFLKH